MAIVETSRERVKKAVEQAFNGTWTGNKRETTGSEERPTRGPAQIEADLKEMVEAIVRGVGAGVAHLDADSKQVEMVFGLKLKPGLSDVFSMLADLDRRTNVRVKVTFDRPTGIAHPAIAEDGAAQTAETPAAPAGNGRSGASSSAAVEDTGSES